MEYTVFSFVSVLIFFYICLMVKLPAKLLLIAGFIVVFFQLIFDNIMTAVGLWVFDFSHTIGLAVPFIPVENLVFGLALMLATISSWEANKNI